MKTLISKQIHSKDRKWFMVDAEGQTLGRLATQIASLISGRDRVDYTPHIDNGAYVVVINAEKIRVSGNKESAKLYRTHSGYMGGLKETPLTKMRAENPTHIIEHAISGMLPKNKLRDAMMQRLKVVAGSDHKFAAQKPEVITF
ncbi:50S ribosomal protein L13 [Candidatus Gracilibacteria bacterium]|nr:MAG: 50S ribosomal protein L13 [Candidatus Gracilibacteria bacterium]